MINQNFNVMMENAFLKSGLGMEALLTVKMEVMK